MPRFPLRSALCVTGAIVLPSLAPAGVTVSGLQSIETSGPIVDAARAVEMDYSVAQLPNGLFDYTFTMRLTNGDGTWRSGQGFGWIIFGDMQSGASPLNGFVGDPGDLPIGPWTGYTTSGGYHNGPTLDYGLSTWVPTQVGQSLSWSGTHSTNQASLIWSSIYTTGGAAIIEFQPMNYVTPVPALDVCGTCPGAMSLVATGCTPGGSVAFAYAPALGDFTIPGGYPCTGIELGIGPVLTLLGIKVADLSGEAGFSGIVPTGACGAKVQALDLSSCDVTGVESLSVSGSDVSWPEGERLSTGLSSPRVGVKPDSLQVVFSYLNATRDIKYVPVVNGPTGTPISFTSGVATVTVDLVWDDGESFCFPCGLQCGPGECAFGESDQIQVGVKHVAGVAPGKGWTLSVSFPGTICDCDPNKGSQPADVLQGCQSTWWIAAFTGPAVVSYGVEYR